LDPLAEEPSPRLRGASRIPFAPHQALCQNRQADADFLSPLANSDLRSKGFYIHLERVEERGKIRLDFHLKIPQISASQLSPQKKQMF